MKLTRSTPYKIYVNFLERVGKVWGKQEKTIRDIEIWVPLSFTSIIYRIILIIKNPRASNRMRRGSRIEGVIREKYHS